jgi:hypothetical protein
MSRNSGQYRNHYESDVSTFVSREKSVSTVTSSFEQKSNMAAVMLIRVRNPTLGILTHFSLLFSQYIYICMCVKSTCMKYE